MNDTQRKALLNGGIATLVTAVLLFTLNATVWSGDGVEGAGSAASTAPCAPRWTSVPSADPDPRWNTLLGVAAIDPDDVWAVGGTIGAVGMTDPRATLVEHWDGTSWDLVPSPNEGTTVNQLNAVAGAASDDVWAVGRSSSGYGDQMLIMHWDGSEWSLVEAPNDRTDGGVLNGVVTIAADDAWAAGVTGDPIAKTERAVLLHWDGSVWSPVKIRSATGGGPSLLWDVDAIAGYDVWAVGYRRDRPIVLHYDGTTWSGTQLELEATVNAVGIAAAESVWAVGSTMLHWDGATWREDTAGRREGELLSVAAAAPTDVWAVGVRPRTMGEQSGALVERFDGTRWRAIPGRWVAGSKSLESVSSATQGSVWAVGYRDTVAGARLTLVVRGRACTPAGG